MKEAQSEREDPGRAMQRAGRLLLVIFVLNGALVATHLGEFWPFSIYPMFSQARTDIHNVVIRQLTEEEQAEQAYGDRPSSELYGEPYGIKARGVDPVDLAKYVRLTEDWDDSRLQGLVRMFAPGMADEELIVLEVRGDIAGAEDARFVASPTVVFNRERARYVGSDAMPGRER